MFIGLDFLAMESEDAGTQLEISKHNQPPPPRCDALDCFVPFLARLASSLWLFDRNYIENSLIVRRSTRVRQCAAH